MSLSARCYLTLAACLVISALGAWLAASSLVSGAGGWAATGLITGLALIAVAVFGIVEAAHLTVVATASTIDECVEQVTALLQGAQREVLIVAGEGSAQFWDRPEVAEPLLGAVDRGVAVEVIIGSRATTTAETILNLVHSGRISVFELPYTPSPHFMVVDSRGFRIESPHALGAQTREGLAWRRGTMGARILEERFAALRAGATQWGWK